MDLVSIRIRFIQLSECIEIHSIQLTECIKVLSIKLTECIKILSIKLTEYLYGTGACEGTLSCSTCHLILKQADFDKIKEKPTDEELDMLDLAYGLTDT